jgi:UDP-N-acetylglucosamine/UDP-N-acetylgalactosamine diphosphorylase
MSPSSLFSTIQARYEAVGQGHVLEYWDRITSETEREAFLQQLDGIAVERLGDILTMAQKEAAATCGDNVPQSVDENPIQPYQGVIGRSSDGSNVPHLRSLGLQAIQQGHVAALVLAGGQGTRLGFQGPKGMYNIQLPSQKSLFCLLAERILRLRQLAAATNAASASASASSTLAPLPFYIMTSPINHTETQEYFAQHNYFGLGKDNVILFQQGMLPCLTLDGKMILETKSKVAMAPDGNGGIYPSLQHSGTLADMEQRGIKYLHVCSIDNALVKPADPVFVGHCIAQKADCGNKSVWKAHAHEKVGVVALRDGKPCVVEYSEISKDMAEQVDAQGRLVYGAGNICNHFFTLDFLRDVVLQNMDNLYHIAYKKIPYYDAPQDTTVTPTTNSGIKLESFIFDVFPLSQNMAVYEVERTDEFAPVKNPPGTDSDSPDTARRMISNLSRRWLQAVGANIQLTEENSDNECCEVMPLTSYAGEGLEEYQGRDIQVPFLL